ncbi:MAG TPA: hypothetical protein VGM73_04175, partial [Candidatus Didemnitutus sp.]
GRADLQTAAVVEPNRAFFYSYHGKALSLEGSDALARKDLALARQIDPKDPTPWLYSAIQDQQTNRYSDAITDMQESIALNDNRRLYRSDFLLDQDKAVRNANLAKIYQNDGMTDLSVREATRAVDSDYTNPSAHLFLADSYYALLDPKRVSLKYQTAWFNELLLANLLSPVGGGPLSQFVSQQEYSKLLEADGAGGSTDTEWRSGGYVDSQNSLFGTYGRLSVGVDFVYHQDNGDRPDSDDLRKEWWWQLKYQVTANDVVYGLLHTREQTGGDLFSNYNNVSLNTGLRFEDKQSPGLALVGWNHHWAPGSDTLFLGGRLGADQSEAAPGTSQLLLVRDPNYFYPGFIEPAPGGGIQYAAPELRDSSAHPVSISAAGALVYSPDFLRNISPFLGEAPVTGVYSSTFDFATERRLAIYSAELEHIWRAHGNTLIAGARWQDGNYDTSDRLDLEDSSLRGFFASPAADQRFRVGFQRQSEYIYDYLEAASWLTVIGGVSFDRLKRPDNFQFPPLDGRQTTKSRSNGKFGLVMRPARWVTLRAAYSEVLGGVTFDDDVRLEPAQFAGFAQDFRTVISESIASSVVAPVYKNKGVAMEGLLPTRLWWGATYTDLHERVDRTVGDFDVLFLPAFPAGLGILPAGTPETLRYDERATSLTLNQLVGSEFAAGLVFRRIQARLDDRYPQIPTSLDSLADQQGTASLDQLALTGNWNAPTGWFASVELDWYRQRLEGVILGTAASATPGDDFWQGNVAVGYRFHHNLREISVGVLNMGNRDYNLSPLDNILEPPRKRTLFLHCRAAF